jgi:hypothetical protein
VQSREALDAPSTGPLAAHRRCNESHVHDFLIERTAYTYRDVPVRTRIRHVNTARLAYLSQLGRH